jgi:hypothetical protein
VVLAVLVARGGCASRSTLGSVASRSTSGEAARHASRYSWIRRWSPSCMWRQVSGPCEARTSSHNGMMTTEIQALKNRRYAMTFIYIYIAARRHCC